MQRKWSLSLLRHNVSLAIKLKIGELSKQMNTRYSAWTIKPKLYEFYIFTDNINIVPASLLPCSLCSCLHLYCMDLSSFWIVHAWFCVCMCLFYFLSINVNECTIAKSSSKSVIGFFPLCYFLDWINTKTGQILTKQISIAAKLKLFCGNMVISVSIFLGKENRPFLKETLWFLKLIFHFICSIVELLYSVAL